MFVLGNPLKRPSFECMSDDDVVLDLPLHVDIGSNQLPPLGSYALEIWNFNMTKSFALDIELSAVPCKLVSDKLISLKKIFYHVDGFGGASTLSKFPGIIRSSFTSEFSLNKAKEMAICEKILVNNDVRKANSHSDREMIIKKIPIDLPRLVVESVFSKFGKIVSIKMQLIGLWQKALVEFELSKVASQVASMWSVFMGKNSVYVALAINDKQMDQHQALLYTFPVGTTAHDLSNLLVFYGGKSCFIGHNPSLYVRDRCAVICFGDKTSKLAAIGTIPIFKGVSLYWAGLSLACCNQCKQFGHISVNCSIGGNSGGCGRQVVSDQNRVHLAEIYKKNIAPIVQPVSFGGKISSSGVKPFSMTSGSFDISDLNGRMASLECSLEFLAKQVSGIVKKLSFVELVPLAPFFCVSPLDVSVPVILVVELDMALDGGLILFTPSVFGADVLDAVLSSSGSKILTSKVDGLEFKMSALKALIGSVLIKDKFDGIRIFTSGLDVGYLDASVAVIINNSLARHVSKVEEISGRVVSVRLLFKDKLSVTVLVNISTFVVLDGDFNESGSGRSASFRFCLELGLVNSFAGHYLAGTPTWYNSRRVEKTIDYIFVSKNLSSAVTKHWIGPVSEFFDMNHSTVMVSVGLGGLLNAQLNGLHKQANKDCWKFRIRDADGAKWIKFKDCVLDKLLLVMDFFSKAEAGGDLDAMWVILEREIVELADEVFTRHWFSEFQCSRNKHSSKFFGLKLLIAKIVSKIGSGNMLGVDCLIRKWFTLDKAKACAFFDLVILGGNSVVLLKHLSSVHKKYRRSKMFESRLAEKTSIRKAIEKHMESFAFNKGGMIQSVLN
ncbi:hypothetical protein G9A89_004860 [Geosiphon pyriformis]|nr:hypothetical protein G9A89_004860 [Geosiphon pyriformis]